MLHLPFLYATDVSAARFQIHFDYTKKRRNLQGGFENIVIVLFLFLLFVVLLGFFHKADAFSYRKKSVTAGVEPCTSLFKQRKRGVYPQRARLYPALLQNPLYGSLLLYSYSSHP